jgi:cohesin loading factor subunit SCC2
LGSINRQGLTHPKETGVTLMTLETSSNRKIAELAFMEHRSLHEKHETVLEREYIKAIQSAYNYQRDIVKDSHGAIPEVFQPKLHLMMEVLKISKMKNRQRFLEKLCSQVNFDVAQLETKQEMPSHLDFARFIIENMAFFEYQTVGELQTVVTTMEKIVSTTGAAVAHFIESEVFDVRLDLDQTEQDEVTDQLMGETVEAQAIAEGAPLIVGLKVDPNRLRQLTTGAVILSCLWEARTHLRRLYGMGTSRHDSKAKALAKDLNKIPMKVQGVHGERFWDEVTSHVNSLETISTMAQKCKAFVELMNVDKELKVQEDDEEMVLDGPNTPPSEGDGGEEAPERGRKRKGAGTPGGRKKRARSGSHTHKKGRSRKSADSRDEEDDMEWI